MLTHRQLFLHHLAQVNPAPLMLEIVHASGIMLEDVNGRKYFDMISGISVSNLGHGNPAVIDAIKKQADQYLHLMVYGELIQPPQVLLAQMLAKFLPPTLNCCYFTNSGTEAIEGAVKLARRITARPEIVAFRNAYHGSTLGALSLMSDEHYKEAFLPLLPGIRFLDFNDFSGLDLITNKTACVVAETIQAEAGVHVPVKGFFSALRKRCTEAGALLISDEVQTGFGRTGTLFAFEQFDFIPDILVLAKGMGGGMPAGAFIASTKMMNTLTNNPALGHLTTFGGHPVCCAAALASLREIAETGLMQVVKKKEELFRQNLKHPLIKNISGRGLLLAVEFESADLNQRIIARCLENGILTDWFLFAPHKMRLAPPLIISEEQVKQACSLIIKSLDESLKN